jgi:hypothetical protein
MLDKGKIQRENGYERKRKRGEGPKSRESKGFKKDAGAKRTGHSLLPGPGG